MPNKTHKLNLKISRRWTIGSNIILEILDLLWLGDLGHEFGRAGVINRQHCDNVDGAMAGMMRDSGTHWYGVWRSRERDLLLFLNL